MGFAQEMRDFISARDAAQKYSAGEQKSSFDTEYNPLRMDNLREQNDTMHKKNNNPEGDELDLEVKRQQIRSAQALAQYHKELLALNARNQTQADPNAGPLSMPATARPTAPAVGGPQSYAPPPQGRPGAAAIGAYRAGGAVKKFADGGAVDSDDGESSTDDDADGYGATAAPAIGPGAGGGTATSTDISARARVVGAGLAAAKAGASYGQNLGNGGRHGAAHAAPAVDMDKIRDHVDPDHRMSEDERNLAAMGHLYQYKMHQGDTDGAARSAFQMLQYYRNASQKYAVLAAVAAQKGDLDVATHAAMKAYANIPDGQNFQVVKTPDGQLSYTMTDMSTGKVTSQAVVPPDQLGQAAMDLAHQGGFDQQLQAAISQQPMPSNAPKPAVPMKVGDKAKLQDQVTEAYKLHNPEAPDANDPKKMVPKYGADDATLHTGAATRILKHANNDVTPEEATQYAVRIADPTITGKGNSFVPKQVDGGVEVAFGKKKVFVPQDDFDALLAKRTEMLDAKKATDEKTKKDGGDSWLDSNSIAEGVTGAVGGALDWAKGDLAKAAKEYPEAAARIKSAIGAVGNAASDAKDYIAKEAARPNIWKAIENGPGEGKI